MRLLLDTHALIWWLARDDRIGPAAKAGIDDSANEVFVSAVSAYEVTLKHRRGKLPSAAALARDFSGEIARNGFDQLEIGVDHAALAGSLAISHNDPFDRLLIAQAQLEGMLLVSNEALFDGFGVRRLW